MEFKVQTSSKQMSVLLEKYRNNCDISPNQPLFIKGEKKLRLLLEGKKNVNSLEKEEWLMQDQMEEKQ